MGGGGRGSVITGEAMGSGGQGETMVGAGGGIFHRTRNPASPGALAAPAVPGSSLTALGRPALLAADSSQAQLPSSSAQFPVAWLPSTPASPPLQAGWGAGKAGASPASHSISFLRSEPLGIGM